MTIVFEVVEGDITELNVDAIVNAANTSLLGGGGVDGAIHRAAGPDLLKYCRTLNGCPTGEARLTPGFRLPAKFVIHTVGPVWHDGRHQEEELLTSCYENCLLLAKNNHIRTIAFPCISTGVYRFPAEKAAKIAFQTILKFIQKPHEFERIIFCCFQPTDAAIYRMLIASNSNH